MVRPTRARAISGFPGAPARAPAMALWLALAACAQVSLNDAPITDLSRPYGAPAAAPSVAPAATPGADEFYTVQKGDTLYHVASTYRIPIGDLARWNGITESTPISIGQRLRLRAPTAAPGPAAGAGAAPDAASSAPGAEASVVPIPSGDKVQVQPLAAVPAPAPPAPPTDTSAPAPVATASVGAANGWIWPVDGRVVVNFDPVHGQGIDIAVADDATVVAVADGEVTYTGSPRDYGNLITIRHAGDLLSVYAHDKSILAKQGDAVKRGQAIATAGRTSGASANGAAPVLHFEVRQKGVPVDPLAYLPVR